MRVSIVPPDLSTTETFLPATPGFRRIAAYVFTGEPPRNKEWWPNFWWRKPLDVDPGAASSWSSEGLMWCYAGWEWKPEQGLPLQIEAARLVASIRLAEVWSGGTHPAVGERVAVVRDLLGWGLQVWEVPQRSNPGHAEVPRWQGRFFNHKHPDFVAVIDDAVFLAMALRRLDPELGGDPGAVSRE